MRIKIVNDSGISINKTNMVVNAFMLMCVAQKPINILVLRLDAARSCFLQTMLFLENDYPINIILSVRIGSPASQCWSGSGPVPALKTMFIG